MNDILIIGESCLDIFVYCDANRLCPDIPVPVLNVVNTVKNPGMAKNVQENILKFQNCDLITNSNWQDITKTRYVDNKTNHHFFRVDFDDYMPRIDLEKMPYDYELIVISDYNKGFLTEEDILEISSKHPNVFIDTKKPLDYWVNYCRYIKINDFEYWNSIKYINSRPEIKDKVIRTCGENGCDFQGKNYPVDKVEVKDSSGAGDSFMAALIVEYLRTGDIIFAIQVANKKASESVRHRGVTKI